MSALSTVKIIQKKLSNGQEVTDEELDGMLAIVTRDEKRKADVLSGLDDKIAGCKKRIEAKKILYEKKVLTTIIDNHNSEMSRIKNLKKKPSTPTPLTKRFAVHPLPLYITAFLDEGIISYRITKDDDDAFRVLPPDGKTWTVRPSVPKNMQNTQHIAALTVAASIRNTLLDQCAQPTNDYKEISVRCRFGQTMCKLGSITWPDVLATDDHQIAHHLEGVMDMLGMIYNQ